MAIIYPNKPVAITPGGKKATEFANLAALFNNIGAFGEKRRLRERQEAADARALAIHEAKMAEYARAEELYKRNEEARFKTDAEAAKNEAIARGVDFQNIYGYGANQPHPDAILRGAGVAQGMVDKDHVARENMVQYGSLQGQTPWPSQEKYLASLAAKHRAGRGISPQLAQVLSRLASMRATEALGEGRKAQNIRDAIGGMQVDGDSGEIQRTKSQQIKTLSDHVRDEINRNTEYNKHADEYGNNAGVTNEESKQIVDNIWKASSILMKEHGYTRTEAQNKILASLRETAGGIARAYTTSSREGITAGEYFTDYIPREVDEMLKIFYAKQKSKTLATTGDVASGAGRPVESKQAQAQQRFNELKNSGLEPEAIKAQLKSEGLL